MFATCLLFKRDSAVKYSPMFWDFWVGSENLGIIVTLIIIPGLFIMVLRKPKDEIHEKKFSQQYSILWEGVSTKSKPQIAYYLVFCLRRIVFCFIAFYFESDEPKNKYAVEPLPRKATPMLASRFNAHSCSISLSRYIMDSTCQNRKSF